MAENETTKMNQKSNKRMGGPFGGPPIGGPAEKAKDFKGTFKNLVRYLKPYWTSIIVVIVFAAISTIFSIVSPKILGRVTNQIVDDYVNVKAYEEIMSQLPAGTKLPKGTTGADFIKKMSPQVKEKIPSDTLEKIKNLDMSERPVFHFDKMKQIAVFLIVLYALSTIFAYVQGWIISGVTQKATQKLRRNISQKINRLPLEYFDKRTYGEVLSRVTNDVDTISQTLNQSLSQIITSIVSIVGIVIMMLSISWLLTLVTIVILPLSFGLIGVIMKKSQVQFIRQQESLGEINGHIEEMYGGHAVMKAFNGEKKSLNKFNLINNKIYDSAWKSQFLSGLMFPIMSFIGNLGYVCVSVLGGWMAIKDRIKIGDIQAFIQYVQQFNQPIVQTANIANIIQSTMAAAERVFEFLNEKEESAEIEKLVSLPTVKGQVEFDNVVFGYDPEKVIIKGLSAKIKPGDRVAIVGPTGAGKTTLVNLLMRFYDVQGGSIKIDGININDMKRADVRQLFGMVLQDTWLFNGTIRDNIAYSDDRASKKEIIEAAEAAHAEHFIHSLPQGYDMELNEETSNISQGEKQLLTIARAMLAKTPMLILDEATSSVDTRTEILIQKAMDNLMKGKTSFVIAHRLSTIRDADLILVMKDGNVIEQGTHEELLAQKGFYESLYKSQFSV